MAHARCTGPGLLRRLGDLRRPGRNGGSTRNVCRVYFAGCETCGGPATGGSTMKHAPSPRALRTRRVPPCALAMCLAMWSPRLRLLTRSRRRAVRSALETLSGALRRVLERGCEQVRQHLLQPVAVPPAHDARRQVQFERVAGLGKRMPEACIRPGLARKLTRYLPVGAAPQNRADSRRYSSCRSAGRLSDDEMKKNHGSPARSSAGSFGSYQSASAPGAPRRVQRPKPHPQKLSAVGRAPCIAASTLGDTPGAKLLPAGT